MTEEQRLAFIREIAPYAQEAYKTLGKVLPSVCIGMACIESGFGGSKLMYSHHAVLGQKVGSGKTATKYWSGKFFTAKTKEEYTVGTHTVITSAFRAYDDLRQCIFNYYELLNTSLYKGVLAGVDYKTQMAQIKKCGYMTSSTEVNSVIKTIEKYNLTIYDTSIPKNNYEVPYKENNIYTTQQDLYVRDNPNGNKIKFAQLTENAKLHAKKDLLGYAILKKGTRVTCKGFTIDKDCGWLHIPSGWICAYNSKHLYVI